MSDRVPGERMRCTFHQGPKRKFNLQCPECARGVFLCESPSFGWLCERNQSDKSWVFSIWIIHPVHSLAWSCSRISCCILLILESCFPEGRCPTLVGVTSTGPGMCQILDVLYPGIGEERAQWSKWIITLMMFAKSLIQCPSRCNCFRALCESQQADGEI